MVALIHDGVLIRPYVVDDVDALNAAVIGSLATLCETLPWAKPDYTRHDTQNWIDHCLRSWENASEYPFGVFDAGNGRLLGGVGLNALNPKRRSANLGYWVSNHACGQGIAAKAAKLAADFGFRNLGLSRIEILILPQNLASQRVAEKLGAHYEGTARNALIHNDLPHDAMVFSLIPDAAAQRSTPPGVSSHRLPVI